MFQRLVPFVSASINFSVFQSSIPVHVSVPESIFNASMNFSVPQSLFASPGPRGPGSSGPINTILLAGRRHTRPPHKELETLVNLYLIASVVLICEQLLDLIPVNSPIPHASDMPLFAIPFQRAPLHFQSLAWAHAMAY